LGGFDCISEIPKSKWDLDAFGPKTQGHQIVQIFASSLVYAEDVSDSREIVGSNHCPIVIAPR
jgi:acyl transferase domain-containing protein